MYIKIPNDQYEILKRNLNELHSLEAEFGKNRLRTEVIESRLMHVRFNISEIVSEASKTFSTVAFIE